METFLEAKNGPIFVAPMVRGSELPFRMYCRRYGFKILYSPMIKSEQVVKGDKQEMKLLETCEGDTPLVAQLSGRDPHTLYAAAKLVINAFGKNLNAIDLNLGCLQKCAEKGKYGAFLLEEPDQTFKCIKSLCKASNDHYKQCNKRVLIFCKIRIGQTISETLKYAQVIEKAGAQLIAVHCRLRQSKHDGLPDYKHAKALVDKINLPIVVNGNINSVNQAKSVIKQTGCLATMSATAILRNPRLLRLNGSKDDEGLSSPSSLALEYINFCAQYPPPDPLYIRKHFRWIFRNELEPKVNLLTDEDWKNAINDEKNGWKIKLWNFLVRPYLNSLDQFKDICTLYDFHIKAGNCNSNMGKNANINIIPTFKSIKTKKLENNNKKIQSV
jgi:tRNA-dihydrouridine synthase 1